MFVIPLQSIIETITTQKSSTFHEFRRYAKLLLLLLYKNPYDIILRIHSIEKITVKVIFILFKYIFKSLCGSSRGLSSAKMIELIRIQTKNIYYFLPNIEVSHV